MAQLTNAQLLTKYNDSATGLFKDNTNREIVPNRPRSLTTDLADSFFNKLNDAYSGAKGQRAGVTAPASLKDIVTTTLSLGVMITFTDSTASNVVRIYELTNETTAESSPTVIRPNDYATTTNERVWRLRVTADVDSDTGGGGGGASDWGDLGGTITDQTDLVAYVDSEIDAAIAGLKWKNAVRVATTVTGTLATAYENGDTVDGVVLATGNRILLKNQSTQSENGIYTVNASGAPTRATDADTAAELEGAAVTVLEGTANPNTSWIQTTDSVTLGSSNIVWTQFGSSVPTADATTAGIAKLYPSTSLGANTDGAPTQNAAKSYADSRITQVITDGVTTTAPSEDAVFDALALKANLASPALTGNPTAPTPTAGDNDTSIATTAFVTNELAIFSLPGPVIISTGTLNIADSHHNKTLIFTVACTVTIPSGLRADLIFDVYAISSVTAVVFTTGITYEASPVGATTMRGGMTGSFRMRTTNSIIAIFGENLQEYLVTPSTDAVTTVATVTDINGCSVTLQESSVYAIKGQLVIGCDNTGGVKFGFVSPSGAFYRITIFGLTTAATAYTRVILVADGLTSVGFCTVNSGGAGGFVTVEGTIELGAGEGGTFKMQFASTTGTQTSTVYRFGSYLRFTKIV